MPLFDFHCRECKSMFEALCRSAAEATVPCPKCGSRSVSRLISRFAVSQKLTPCGSRAQEAALSCGYNPRMGGCGHCEPH